MLSRISAAASCDASSEPSSLCVYENRAHYGGLGSNDPSSNLAVALFLEKNRRRRSPSLFDVRSGAASRSRDRAHLDHVNSDASPLRIAGLFSSKNRELNRRVPERRAFQGFGGDRFRTAVARACTAAGVPAVSLHDLRHRRISLLHLGGVPWARIGEHVGQRNLGVTANAYTHVRADEIELDYAGLLRSE